MAEQRDESSCVVHVLGKFAESIHPRTVSSLGSIFFSKILLPLVGNKFWLISTNNIATGMVRGGRKIRFCPPKVRFHAITKLPTNATGKSEIMVEQTRTSTPF
jgi:hypothetical protein